MDFDFQWLLLGLPVAFALGWLASRIDLRQWRTQQQSAPKAYFKGLNFLLNEQQDKAIDAFITAVQHDPDTSELHFALGNLFRRRGEYERAVRVHQHLLDRADLPRAERERAQHALAQDFLKAGLFDRAEQAYRALLGTAFRVEALLALLTLYERSRDWPAAIEVAGELEAAGAGAFSLRTAHYWCELAQEAETRGDATAAEEALQRARTAAPQAPRPLVVAGQRLARAGRHDEAMRTWAALAPVNPAGFSLVALEYAQSALAAGQAAAAREMLGRLYEREPSLDLLNALRLLEPHAERRHGWLSRHLQQHPSLSAVLGLLDESATGKGELPAPDLQRMRQVLGDAARPLQRYRCAACGFEAQRYFWQCPGCQSWDSYPPRRIEDL